MSRRAAAIDIGTNSVLLAVAERRGGEIVALLERSTITRLGAGVDRTRTLDGAACDRTLACLAEYRRELDALGPTRLDVVGTSALRDAGGGPELCERAERILGVRPRVLSGAQEAELGFEGACVGLGEIGPRTVFDVGGGSTEIVVGDRKVEAAVSLDIGSVRLFERHVRSDPPTRSELEAIDAAVDRALAKAPAPRGTLVGVAGTVTTLCALDRGITIYDANAVHGAALGFAAVERLASALATTTIAERRALPGMEPGRADVIVVGARIVRPVMAWAGAQELVVSDRGVRWGLLVRAL